MAVLAGRAGAIHRTLVRDAGSALRDCIRSRLEGGSAVVRRGRAVRRGGCAGVIGMAMDVIRSWGMRSVGGGV